MGVCIPNPKNRQISDISQAITLKTNRRFFPPFRLNHTKKNSFLSNSFFLNQKKQKDDDEEVLKFLKIKNLTKYNHVNTNTPLLRTKRESFHNNNDTTIRSLETQSLKRILSHSIKLFNNRTKLIPKFDEKIIKKDKGTVEFLKHHNSLDNIQNGDFFVPCKKTLREELKDTLPYLKVKFDRETAEKPEVKRSVSLHKKNTKNEEMRSMSNGKKKKDSSADFSVVSQIKSVASMVRIKPSHDFKEKLEQNPNAKIIERLKRMNTGNKNSNLRVLHEGKVVIFKKNNFIVRNDKVVKII